MATTSFTVMRRFAGFAFTLTLFGLCLTGMASGQGSPLVTASSAAGLSHPTGWGTIQETAIDQAGDWLVVDYANGGVYEFPAGGGAAIASAARARRRAWEADIKIQSSPSTPAKISIWEPTGITAS